MTVNNFKELDTILSNLKDGVTVADMNGKYVYVNEAFSKMSGYTTGELLNLTVFDMIKITIKEDSVFERSKTNDDFANKKVNLKRKDGTLYMAEVSGKKIMYHGNPHVLGIIKDITKQVESELAIKESNEKFKQLVETTSDWIWEVDINGKYTYSSPKIFDLLGYLPTEIIGKSPFDLMPKEEAKRVGAIFSNYLKKLEPFTAIENLNIHKNGSEVFIETSGTPIFDKNGKLVGYRGIDRDITERKISEKALQVKSNQIQTLAAELEIIIDSIPGLVFYKDTENRYIRVNKFVCEAHNMTKEQMEGKSMFDLYPKKQALAYYEDDLQVINSKQPKLNIDEPWETPTGKRWISTSKIPYFNNKGKVIGIIGISLDVTDKKKAELALKESEQKLKEAQKIGNVGHWEYDKKNQTIFWSDQMYQIYETTKENFKLTTDNLFDFMHPDDKKHCAQKFNKFLEKNQDGELYCRIITALGNLKYAHTVFKFQYDNKGNPYKILGTTADITKEKIIELELKKAVDTKNKFFSILAHDLKSPFNVILGFTDLLINDYKNLDDSGREEFLQLIDKASKNTYKLIENLLDWSRSQLGSINYTPKNHVLKEIMDNVLQSLKDHAELKNIELDINIPYNSTITCDIYMIQTILRNFIGNAIKFTPRGGNITVQTYNTKESTVFSVTDTGVGISDEKIRKLFDISEKISTVGTEHEKGTGLGLILCKEFIDFHKGSIHVKSKESKGSTFSFSIPNSI